MRSLGMVFALVALVCLRLQALAADDLNRSLTQSESNYSSTEIAPLRIRLSVGDALLLKHKGTVPGAIDGDPTKARACPYTGETTLVVVDQNKVGIMTVFGQSVLRGTGPDGKQGEGWAVYAYKADGQGKIIDFPMRNWLMHARAAQALDISGGAFVPFSLSSQPLDVGSKWIADVCPPKQHMTITGAEAQLVEQSEKGIARLSLDLEQSNLPGNARYEGSVIMLFDILNGVPLSWTGENKFILGVDTPAPVTLSSTFDTQVQRYQKLTPDDLAVISNLAPSLLHLQSLVELANENWPIAEELANQLEMKYGKSTWLRGMHTILSQIQVDKEAVKKGKSRIKANNLPKNAAQ